MADISTLSVTEKKTDALTFVDNNNRLIAITPDPEARKHLIKQSDAVIRSLQTTDSVMLARMEDAGELAKDAQKHNHKMEKHNHKMKKQKYKAYRTRLKAWSLRLEGIPAQHRDNWIKRNPEPKEP